MKFAQLIMSARSPDETRIIKIGSVHGDCSHMHAIYSHPRNACLPFLFLSRAKGRTAGPIWTLDGSFDADFAKEVLFKVMKTRTKF
jgi:hypothetical protein